MKYLIPFLMLFALPAFSQDEAISAFLEKWENSKNYLIEMAQSMPEEQYVYKPSEREMSFSEQLLHIKSNMDWLSSSYFGATKIEKSEKKRTKDEIIAELKISFDAVAAAIKKTKAKDLKLKVDFFAGPKTKLQIMNLLQDHVTHHRGQLIVYLNLNDIKPPKYVGW